MKFSIIVPLCSNAGFIAEALGSVLGQTCRDFEVIVVDVGPTDAGAQVARALRDPRIRTAREENGGASAARNHGIRLARGEWVCFLDAGGRLHPTFLETQLRAISQHPHASFVATGYRKIPAENWKDRIDHWPVSRGADRFELIDDLPSRWMKSPTFVTGGVAIRRSLLQELQPCFVDGESAGEDLDLFFRVAERSVIVFNPAPLHAYRAGTAGRPDTLPPAENEPPFLSRLELRARTALADPAARSTIRFVQEIRISHARNLLAAGRRIQALRMLWRSRSAARRHRWWTTAAMTLWLPVRLAEVLHQRQPPQCQDPGRCRADDRSGLT